MKTSWIAPRAALAGMLLACAGHAWGAYSPTNVPGLELWLKVDAGGSTNASGVVTSWVDQVRGTVAANLIATPIELRGRHYRGRLAELLLYRRRLSGREPMFVGRYLSEKYGIGCTLPSPARWS